MNRKIELMSFILVVFLLPSCHLLKRKEAKKEEAGVRGIASFENSGLIKNSKFVRIPAGEFMMGSPANERHRDEDENGRDGKQVRVKISKPFMMMATEVTQSQYLLVMSKSPSELKRRNPSKFRRRGDCDNYWDGGNKMCPDNPVDSVTWKEAQIFIKELNKAEGIKGCKGTPQDQAGCYRLPTEAEWEWAVRGKTETAYFFGNDSSQLGRYAKYSRNSKGRTHKVRGERLSNRYGLYDVYGNVAEWVQDSYQYTLPGGVDPLVTVGSRRVFRGGGWRGWVEDLRSASRDQSIPGYRSSGVGFRLVRNL